MVKKRFTYGVSDKGVPLGEAHPKAKLTDEEVEAIRTAYDNGEGGYRKLARRFGISRTFLRDIVQMKRRNTTPDDYKTVNLEVEAEMVERPDWFRHARKTPPEGGNSW